MRAAAPAAPLTLDLFLDREEWQPERFGLVGGAVRVVAGGTEGGRGDEAVEGLDSVLELPDIEARLPPAEIHEDTELAAEAAAARR